MAKTHKTHVFHLRRLGLFSVLILSYFVVRFDAGAMPEPVKQPAHVLAFASEMSRSALASSTNAARAANGLGGFTLDSQLNSSAQMKAEDMAAKNYWAHVAPDGTQPWYFFGQAGYEYIRAGENLAYGFSTSQGTVDGWMNSASHRANILGNYNDVGFGIVNVPDYQSSGQQTIVVAHYGTRPTTAAAPAPAPAPTAPVTPPSSSAPQVQSAPASVPTDTVTPPPVEKPAQEADLSPDTEPTHDPAAQNTAKTEEQNNAEAVVPVQTAQSSQVSVLSMIATKHAPVGALFSLVLVSLAVVGYALTHRSAFQHAVTNGEHFVVSHPGVDTGIIAAVTTLILLTTYGNIS